MAREIQPKDTTRNMAYELWMKAPNPMVTFFKTLDVTNLVKVSKKKKMKFNMLLDYCIGKAAANVKEFYIIHKPDFGCVDLTINGSGHKKAEMKMLENCLHKFGFSNLRVLTTHKSAAIRIDSLHTFSFKTGLPESKEEVFNECFCAMRQLLEIMDFVESIINLTKK